ncbi:hypothetical protein [Prevotella sp.]|uniref:hypothetical protein n=1 Tax=Prevotella sp. TaxID=59823 RepID=UPI003FD769A2
MTLKPKYDTSINIMGGIPDFASMIDYITVQLGCASEESAFRFRSGLALYKGL